MMPRANHMDAGKAVWATLDRLAGDLTALGVAVSGGGDSTALLHMVAEWACERHVMVATVDHNLREGSRDEARNVGEAAKRLGFQHETLIWDHRNATGNLQANARQARLRLLSAWAQHHSLQGILLGHTSDDQAETLLMRLSRGSGIDGLTGMAERREALGVQWIRPMLKISRAELRNWLSARSIAWAEDPSNQNEGFDRIRIRKAMSAMRLDPASLSQSAAHIREARAALAHYSAEAASDAMARNGSLFLPAIPFRRAPTEIRRRLTVAGCRWVTGTGYPPRRDATLHALGAINDNLKVTLDGCLIEPRNDQICFYREPAAAFRAPASHGKWDDRWQITGLRKGQHIAALGTAPLPRFNWRGAGMSHDEAAASPAIWEGETLIEAPLVQPETRYAATPLRDIADLHDLLILH